MEKAVARSDMKKKEPNPPPRIGADTTERNNSLEALRASERRFKSIFDGAAEGIIVADAETGTFLFTNRSAYEMFGYHEEGMTGLSPVDIHPTGELHWALSAFNDIKNGIIDRMSNLACQRSDGSVFYANVRGSRIEMNGKECLAGFFTDITSHRNAELALKERIDRYELVIRGSGAALWDWDVVEKRVMFSPRWKELRGYREDEINGTEEEWKSNIHPEDMPRVMASVESHFRGETVHFSEEYRVRRKDGSWFWIHDRGLALRDGTGDVVRMAGLETDITERKRAEEDVVRENREIALMNRLLRAFTETDGNELFDQVLRIAMEGLASSHGVFGYIAEPGHLVCPSLTKMLDECEIEGKCIHYPPEKWKGLWARSLTEKRPIYSNLPSRVPPGHPDILNNLASPILYRGEAIGLLNLANREGGYTDADQDLLVAMADRIAPLLYAWIQKKLREDERSAAEEALRGSEDLNRRTLQALPAHIAVLDQAGRIIAVNQAWTEFAAGNEAAGSPAVEVGADYLEVCRRAASARDDFAARALVGIESVMNGALLQFSMEYPCHSPREQRWFLMTVAPLGNGGAVITHLNITNRKTAEESLTKIMSDLKEANDELTRFNKAMVGRELRMIELKKEVNDLCARIGQPPPYLMFEDG